MFVFFHRFYKELNFENTSSDSIFNPVLHSYISYSCNLCISKTCTGASTTDRHVYHDWIYMHTTSWSNFSRPWNCWGANCIMDFHQTAVEFLMNKWLPSSIEPCGGHLVKKKKKKIFTSISATRVERFNSSLDSTLEKYLAAVWSWFVIKVLSTIWKRSSKITQYILVFILEKRYWAEN